MASPISSLRCGEPHLALQRCGLGCGQSSPKLLAGRWVRENAAAFGGDPLNVMIFGCSAGGASVAGLLVNRAADRLYSAAALESPGGHQGWMVDAVRNDDDWMVSSLVESNSDTLARQLGCASRADLECLQATPLDRLYEFSRRLRFAPSLIDGNGRPSFPLREIRRGAWSRVPTIVGEM